MTTPTDKDLRALAEALSGHDWYVLGPPWAGFTETFTILRDSPDPHAGEAILETIPIEDMDEDDDHYRQEHLAQWLEAADPATVIGLLDRIEALDSECDEQLKTLEALQRRVNETTQVVADKNVALKAELSATRSQLEEAKAALKPFQKLANSEHYSTLALGEGIDHWPVEYTKGLTLGDLRRAAKAGGADA
tara:strand:+ start:644 stop:1219 length:576 start_codon:yes stop_codon:yes gene_type:complete